MMRFRTRCHARILLVLLLLAGCGRGEDPVRFVATIPPLGAVVELVAGEHVGVMLPGGGTPHTYEPRPSDARAAAGATILFFGSKALDGWAASMDTPQRIELIELLPETARRYVGETTDPHFWMDPLAVRALLPGLADVFCRNDAAGCDAYRRRARSAADQLDAANDSLSLIMAPFAGTSVLVSHHFLGYFANRYGLHVAGIIEPVAGIEPSPRQVERLIRTARASAARAVILQPQHASRAARAVAASDGLPVVTLDPIDASAGLIDLLYLTAERLRTALTDS